VNAVVNNAATAPNVRKLLNLLDFIIDPRFSFDSTLTGRMAGSEIDRPSAGNRRHHRGTIDCGETLHRRRIVRTIVRTRAINERH
jgi:hypothetical protein